MEGDQLIACPGERDSRRRPVSSAWRWKTSPGRRAMFRPSGAAVLADTAGGCNPDFDPFRRLPLTWAYNYPGESGDGLNWVNSHVVNIPKETSPAHFHPPTGIGGAGGIPQREMYLVLDPRPTSSTRGAERPRCSCFPTCGTLRRYEQHPLEPGMFVYIPPGTGHRGLDVLVNVLTIPGFKPHNEFYIDREIRDTTGGASPYNENLL